MRNAPAKDIGGSSGEPYGEKILYTSLFSQKTKERSHVMTDGHMCAWRRNHNVHSRRNFHNQCRPKVRKVVCRTLKGRRGLSDECRCQRWVMSMGPSTVECDTLFDALGAD